jgi:DNA polymerase-3 subunit epsilon
VETTGTDTEVDRIIDIAAIKITPDDVGKSLNELDAKLQFRFNPQMPIPAEATEIHGITNEEVEGCPQFSRHAQEIFTFFSGCDMGGYNAARFDIPILNKELNRTGLSLDLTVNVIDPMQIFYQREPRNLEAAVMKYTGREIMGAHNAMHDVISTLEVLRGQLDLYQDLPRTPEGIYTEHRDSDQVDFAGKLKWRGEYMTFTFGKEKGKPFHQVPMGYFRWVKSNNVIGPDAVAAIDKALNGEFYTREEWPDGNTYL